MDKPTDRIKLAEMFAELGFTRGAEVGVCTGRYSRILMEKIPNLKLLGVDPYTPYKGYTDFRRESTHATNLGLTREAMAPYHDSYTLAIGFGHEVAQWLPDESLDFVFIDGNHQYEAVREDIADWFPKVRKGGILSGHDYYEFKSGRGGVVRAVDEFAQAQGGLEVNSTGWTEGAHHDDKQPDWWFVK